MNRNRLCWFFIVLFLLSGCKTSPLTETVGKMVGGSLGSAIKKSGEALDATTEGFEDFTPEQEYYLGRGVAAALFGRYKPLNDPGANEYLNLLGQSIAGCAVQTYPPAQYRFYLLDSDEVNAFSAPGGFILVTRGLIEAVENEDELAAVLAHEISHIQLKHGIDHAWFNKAIEGMKKSGNITADVLLTSKGRSFLNTVYNDTVDQVVLKLMHTGYSGSDEEEADKSALELLGKAGYARAALPRALMRLNQRAVARGGFGQTHPAPDARIRALDASGTVPDNPARQERFVLAFQELHK